MQARGAAIASLSTQSVVSVLQFIIAMKELRVPMKTIPWLSCLIFTVLLIPTSIISTRVLHCHVIWALLITAGAALLIGFASRLLNFKELRKTIS